jgi:hypothetical protein
MQFYIDAAPLALAKNWDAPPKRPSKVIQLTLAQVFGMILTVVLISGFVAVSLLF